ncbi:MAG: 4Fe-4S binding protein [Phascolarctobacterium sp.]|nr:4Fe-4S binding protein [Phascolarctobacterium sp.]
MIFIVDRGTCIACEECVAICPVGAVSIREGKALIDYRSCLSCGACMRECPEDAISAKNGTAENQREGGILSE